MKKFWPILFVLLLLFSSSVSAHTGLKSANPADGETVTNDIQEIKAEFNTAIENGSTVSLLNENGEEIHLDSSQTDEKTLVGKLEEPLESGGYMVNWRIIGEDGHPIEGNYSFNVQPENETNESLDAADEQTTENNPAAGTEEPAEKSNPAQAADKAEEKGDSTSNIVIPLVIGVMLAAVFQTAMWLIRRGKK